MRKTLSIFFILLLQCHPVWAACRRRIEWSKMTSSQRTRYLNALNRLKSRPMAGANADASRISYDDFSQWHVDNGMTAHGTPQFLPWHRWMLWRFETALQTIDPNVTIPFWDWAMDSQAPASARVFRADAFGSNGVTGTRCVRDGVAGTWVPNVGPTRNCIQRCYDGGNMMRPLYPPETLDRIIEDSTTYDTFRTTMEASPHGRVHNAIGGNCGGTATGDMAYLYSPNDPIFYLHHANVDRYWTLWQKLCPRYANSYGGRNANGATARTSDAIVDSKSSTRVTVANILDLNGAFCIEYGPADSDTTLTCPTRTSNRTTTTRVSPTATLDVSSEWLPLNFKAIVQPESGSTLRRRSDVPIMIHSHHNTTTNSWNCSMNYQNYVPESYNKNASCKILMPPYTQGMPDMEMCEFELRLTDNHLLASIDFYNQIGKVTRAKRAKGC